MILGIDHISLSVCETEQTKKELEEKGFVCTFLDFNVPNKAEKKSLLTHYQPTHDIGYFKSGSSHVAIEITNHGLITENDSPFYYRDDYIELQTPDVQKETFFWKSVLNFKEDASNNLVFNSFLPTWSCKIKMIEKKFLKYHTLDSKGHACLAFLTNHLENDIQKAKEAGAYDITSPFNLVVNNKNLRVLMFRTPGGAICELIKIMK